LLTPKILTDLSGLNSAHGFSRGLKIYAYYSFPPLKRWAMEAVGYLNRKTLLKPLTEEPFLLWKERETAAQ
jgi:hypothetical protein